MKGHPGGEKHTRRMIELAALMPHSKVLDMGAGAGETVRLLNGLGYDAHGIDTEPRGENVGRGDMLHTPYPDGSFDGIISQCAFYVSGDVDAALKEAYRLLKPGGALMLSDVWFTDALKAVHNAGFEALHREDMTAQWREYYIEAIWRGDTDCIPVKGKCTYEMLICRKGKNDGSL